MKRKFLILYVIIALVLLCTNVYAALTTDLSLTTDKTSVKAGEEIIVSVNLKNMSSPITLVKGFIDVDENVLSALSESMIVTNNGKIEVISNGSITNSLKYVYAPNSSEDLSDDIGVIFNTKPEATQGHDMSFTEIFDNDLSSDSVILKLKFTVKEGVANGDLTNAVRIEGLKAESDDDELENLSASVTIKVENPTPVQEDSNTNKNTNNDNANTNKNTNTDNTNTNTNKNTNTGNTNTNTSKNTNTGNTNTNTNKNTNKNNTNTNTNKNTNTNNTNTNTNKNTNTNTNKNTNTDNTVAGTKIPATGAKTIIIPGLVLCLLGFISYKKYLDYKEI